MQQKVAKTLLVLVGAGLISLYQHFKQPNNSTVSTSTPVAATSSVTPQPNGNYQQAVEKIRQSRNNPDAKFAVTVQGKVVKLLKDDLEGNQHQRFLVALAPDITLLVAHNTELAPRAPVAENTLVTISGEYVWNNKGGVLHWTHHDPQGRKGGWIEVNGKRYE